MFTCKICAFTTTFFFFSGGHSPSAGLHQSVFGPDRRRLRPEVMHTDLLLLVYICDLCKLDVCFNSTLSECSTSLFQVFKLCVRSLNRLGVVLLVLHYFVELLFHVSRIIYFSNEERQAG